MNKVFVRTKNVRNFIGLVENLISKPSNIPKMGLVYGEPGLGKSQTALWLAMKYDCIYIRCANFMTSRWLLEELVKELNHSPYYLTQDNFNLCVNKLSQQPQIVMIDEIDYLINDTRAVETLRDIHDKTGVPIILVGMGLVHKKLERYRHLYDRFSEIVKFEKFDAVDVKQIVDELSEVPVENNAIEILHKKHNRFRQIVQTINSCETVAKENNLIAINKEIMEVIL